MDPFGTGFVSQEEFKDVVQELCVHLSEFEVRQLVTKFDTTKDGRYTYLIDNESNKMHIHMYQELNQTYWFYGN